MGMQLNIKGEEAYRLASQLTALTGESLTAAVTEALRLRLEAEEAIRRKAAWKAEILEAARAFRDEVMTAEAGPFSSNHDFLYDKDGLPV